MAVDSEELEAHSDQLTYLRANAADKLVNRIVKNTFDGCVLGDQLSKFEISDRKLGLGDVGGEEIFQLVVQTALTDGGCVTD